MPGENRKNTLQLDPVVDLACGGLGWIILTLLAAQLLLLMARYLPDVRTGLLTFAAAAAILIGMVGRKMRRGQHDLPRLVRAVELLAAAGLSLLCQWGSPTLTQILSCIPVLVGYLLAYELSHWSEELLFDFAGFSSRSNWQRKWETEGFRLYDRHLVGFRHLQNLMFAVDGCLVLAWLIAGRPGFWSLIGGGLMLFFQLIFAGVIFYQKKRIAWAIGGYEVDARVVPRLLGLVVILALVVSALAMVLPVRYNPIPWKVMGDWLTVLLNGRDSRTVLPSGPQIDEPKQMGDPFAQHPVMAMGNSWHVWIFFVLLGVTFLFFLAVLIGYLLSYWAEERYRLQGLPALLIRVYRFFREMISGWWRGLRHGVAQLKTGMAHQRERRLQAKLRELSDGADHDGLDRWQPRNTREEIMYLFQQLMRAFRAQGCVRAESQTLTEYCTLAAEQFSGTGSELRLIRRLVTEAVYSFRLPHRESVEMMTAAVRRIEKQLDQIIPVKE